MVFLCCKVVNIEMYQPPIAYYYFPFSFFFFWVQLQTSRTRLKNWKLKKKKKSLTDERETEQKTKKVYSSAPSSLLQDPTRDSKRTRYVFCINNLHNWYLHKRTYTQINLFVFQLLSVIRNYRD